MFNVVCTLDRYKTMLTSTEFAAKSNGFRPQEDLTFALNVGYVICNSTLSFNKEKSVSVCHIIGSTNS